MSPEHDTRCGIVKNSPTGTTHPSGPGVARVGKRTPIHAHEDAAHRVRHVHLMHTPTSMAAGARKRRRLYFFAAVVLVLLGLLFAPVLEIFL